MWVAKGSEFYNSSFKNAQKVMILKCIRYLTMENLLLPILNNGKSVVTERFIRTLKSTNT